MAQTWELAQAWYHDRLSPEFRGRSLAEAAAIVHDVGLTSSFWQPAGSDV